MVFRTPVIRKLTVSLAIILGGLGILGIFFWNHDRSPIPSNLRKQFSFLVFYPTPTSTASVDRKTIKYDGKTKVMSFITRVKATNITVAEQTTPEGFVDIPQAYDKFISNLHDYSTFDSLYGTVHLTHPEKFRGQQSAVMNAKGTLMFAHPTNGDLSVDQWKRFFNNLEIIK